LVQSPQEAGDSITYQITIDHLNTGNNNLDAFDLIFTDVLDADLTLSSINYTTQPAYLTVNDLTSGNNIDLRFNRLETGDSIVFEVTALVDNSILAGKEIVNNAELEWTSLPGVDGTNVNPTGSITLGASGNVDGERNGTDQDSGGVNNYYTSDSVTAEIGTPQIDKQTPSVTTYSIGENVTYDILVSVPEGTTADLDVVDLLPTGLNYISHSVIETVAGSAGLLTNDFSGSLSAPTIVGGASDGDDVTLQFGNVSVPVNAVAADNSFVVRITAQVSNILSSQNGDLLTNAARLQFTNPNTLGTDTIDSVNQPQIEIVEPILQIQKAVSNQSSYDAGDNITYTVNISHHPNSTADAFNVSLIDTLPTQLSSVSIDSVIAAGFSNPSSEISSGQVYVPNIADSTFDMPLGSSIEIVYSGTLSASVQPGELIENSAQIDWQSNDTPNSETRGSGTGEYDYSESGTNGLNDYQGTQSQSFNISQPTFSKTLVTSGNSVIGEIDSYDLLITLPEGVTDNVSLSDQVPTGYTYDSLQLITTTAGSTLLSQDFAGSVSIDSQSAAAVDGQDVQVDFGQVVVTDDNNAGNNSFVLRVNLVVSNINNNQDGTNLNNVADFSYYNSQTSSISILSDSDNAAVVEPVLQINKVATSFPTEVGPGSTITYQIDVSHHPDSSADAVDIVLSDVLNSQLENINNVIISSSAGISDPSSQVSGNTLTVPNSVDTFNLPLGESFTVTFDVDVTNTVGALENITNDVSVIWESIDNANGRDGADGVYDLTNTSTNGLNDYSATVTESSVTTSSPEITKHIVDSSNSSTSDVSNPIEAGIGEELEFMLLVTIPEGITPSLVVSDNLPSNLEYLSHQFVELQSDGFGLMGQDFNGVTDNFIFSQSGDDLIFELININNSVDGQGANNNFGILVSTRVRDIPANTGLSGSQTSFTNNTVARVGITDIPNSQLDIELVEPDINIQKDIIETQTWGTEEVDVQIQVENQGLATAYDVSLTDDISSYFTMQTGTIAVTCDTVTSSHQFIGTELQVEIAEMPVGESCLIEFSLTTNSNSEDGVTSTNVADIVYSSQPGVVIGERSYSANDSDDIDLLSPDLSISKSNTNGIVNGNELIIYDIQVENIGTAPSAGILITENIPVGTSFITDNSSSGWTCLASSCTFDFNNIWVGDFSSSDPAQTIQFAVLTDNTFDAGQAEILNTVSVSDDGSNGVDSDLSNNEDTFTNPLSTDLRPDLSVQKLVDRSEVFTGEVLTYTINYENLGSIGATGVELNETIPTGTVFRSDLTSSAWVCTGVNAGDTCTLDLGSLEVNDTGAADFVVEVIEFFPIISAVSNSVSITDDGNNGIDEDLSNNDSSISSDLLYTNVFDPPTGTKVFNETGGVELEWRMVWINDGNTTALDVFITDNIPQDTTYVPGSFTCEPRGTSVTTRCDYNPVLDRVEWEGEIGPDVGGTDEDDSDNEVILTFRITLPPEMLTVENQAQAYWDGDGDGDVTDDITNGQIPVVTNDPTTLPADDPTVWESPLLAETGIDNTYRILFAFSVLGIAVLVMNVEKLSSKLNKQELSV
jgi:fimbrial isopeptide formation D2 family protein/uncharacterized repeat protein (TIGR01451 family)